MTLVLLDLLFFTIAIETSMISPSVRKAVRVTPAITRMYQKNVSSDSTAEPTCVVIGEEVMLSRSMPGVELCIEEVGAGDGLGCISVTDHPLRQSL